MLYPILTVCAGVLMTVISAFSLVRCAQAGGIFINQLRFLISGILLTLHFPLTDWGTEWALPHLQQLGAGEEAFTLAYWGAMAAVVTAQLVVIPTRRDLYATYLADRLARAV
jgi:hypothetical protein